MSTPRLTRLELRIMEALWEGGPVSIREIQERFPAAERPAYTTVQTIMTIRSVSTPSGASRRSATPICSRRSFPEAPPNAG